MQLHLWRTYNLPVLLSGLPALPIRPQHVKPLAIFHNKILRGILKLSQSSPTPALYFLLGELPAEALLHIRTLSLLHNIWINRNTTVSKIVQYLLKMCKSSSTTWSNHIQLLCLKYGLPSPLALLQTDQPWCKQTWDCLVKTRVTIWYENEYRRLASTNTKMKYLNVQLCGLSGTTHPVLHNIHTMQDAKKLRLHLKFLTCDILTNERLFQDNSITSPACSICLAPVESIEHVVVVCKATNEVRSRLLPELLNSVAKVQPNCGILLPNPEPSVLTQFIIDCTSLNLPNTFRIPSHNPGVSTICNISRDWCFSICNERSRRLELLNK